MGLESNRHLLIIDPAAGDEFIERRLDAVGRLKGRIRRKTGLREQLVFAQNVVAAFADGKLDAQATKLTSEALSAAAPSFVDNGDKENELSIVFALGCADAIDIGTGTNGEAQMKFLARAIRLGVSYLAPLSEPKREAFRGELVKLASSKLESSAEDQRQRIPITSPTTDNSLTIISALSANARWDREEIDLLWWVVNDWSNVADRRVSGMVPEVACVMSALETSGLFAGPAAQGHRNIALRHVRDVEAMRSPAQFADGSAEARGWARHSLKGALADIATYPMIVPALKIATQEGDENAASSTIAAGAELSLADWCRRLIDEIELLKLLGHKVSLEPAA